MKTKNPLIEAGLFYFGTELNQAGHFLVKVYDDYLDYHHIRYDLQNMPFECEDFPDHNPLKGSYGQRIPPNGAVYYRTDNGCTAVQIAGSCYDHRPQSKTVFFVKHSMDMQEFVKALKEIPIAQQIFAKMEERFKIMW